MGSNSEKEKIEMSQYVLSSFPDEAQMTRIEYEGSMLAVYAKRPEILIERNDLIAEIVNVIRKRIVIRSDPSVRLPEKQAEKSRSMEVNAKRICQSGSAMHAIM